MNERLRFDHRKKEGCVVEATIFVTISQLHQMGQTYLGEWSCDCAVTGELDVLLVTSLLLLLSEARHSQRVGQAEEGLDGAARHLGPALVDVVHQALQLTEGD